MTFRFDPSRAVDFSQPPPIGPLFGWFGPYPSRACSCGHGEFSSVDWNLGYRCVKCNAIFGTQEEWDYYRKK